MDGWLQYTFCFEGETFQGRDIADMLHLGIGFVPKKVHANNAFRLNKSFAWEDLDTLSWEGFGVSATFWARAGAKIGDEPRIFSIKERVAPGGGHAQLISLIVHPDALGKISLVDHLLTHPRLQVAYCCDEENFWIQNADSPTPYQVRGRSYAHLNVYWDEEWVEERIDISQNPGRSQFVEGYELSSCWRMWFGPKFFGLVPKERLLAFPDARRIETTEAGHVFIELYADPFEADLKENRRRQQAFRDWIDLDGLAERLQAEAEQ